MLPKTEFELNEVVFENNEVSNYTSWALLETTPHIGGTIYNEDVLKQQIYMILNTERYSTPIYSNDYGVELEDLIGENVNDVKMLIVDRLEDALLQHPLIESVSVDKIEQKAKNTLLVTLTCDTIYDIIVVEKEVSL